MSWCQSIPGEVCTAESKILASTLHKHSSQVLKEHLIYKMPYNGPQETHRRYIVRLNPKGSYSPLNYTICGEFPAQPLKK